MLERTKEGGRMSREPQRIAEGVYRIGLGGVNAFLVETDDGGLVLVDTGTRKDARAIGLAVRALGHVPRDVRGIVVTHLHGDHVGGLATVKAKTGAQVWMHPVDAAAVREGVGIRALEPGPGRVRTVIVRGIELRERGGRPREPVAVEHEVADGEVLPWAGLLALHTPGHTAGHLALLLPRGGGVLFVGDAATNVGRLGWGPIYEDVAAGERSLRRLAALDFEVAAFAHGSTIKSGASARFRKRWPPQG
jgi:glyoxylase-like metal-dependent hydrolase (beta-lactamase superfamily II)